MTISPVLSESFAEEIAGLSRVVPVPEAPFGYGTDLDCADDLDEYASDISGASRLALAQAVYRRLITTRGKVVDDPDYGYDVVALLHKPTSQEDLIAYAGEIRSECLKDDRVSDASVTITPSASGDVLKIEVRIEAEDPDLEAFTLTIALSDAGVLLEEIS